MFDFPSITSIFDGWNTSHSWDFLESGCRRGMDDGRLRIRKAVAADPLQRADWMVMQILFDPSTSRKNYIYILYILYIYPYILYQMGQHIQYPSTYPNQMGQHLDIESNIIDPSTCRNNCSIYIGFNLSPMIDLGPWKNHPSPAMKPQGLLRITQLRQYGLPQVSCPMKICRKT
jgi:hypothetical protein